jgi:hydrogenase maturation factor
MCLGEYGTVVEQLGDGRAVVRFGDGRLRDVSLAVLVAEGTTVACGDVVAVSIGMALHLVDVDDTVDDTVEQELVDHDEEVAG